MYSIEYPRYSIEYISPKPSRVVHPTPLDDQAVNYSCWWIYGATTASQEVLSHNT